MLTIIKIGSNVLVDEKNQVRMTVLEDILEVVGQKIKQGEKIVLVTSGAVALGRAFFAGKEVDKKLAAGIGQAHLISSYLKIAQQLNLSIAQILLTRLHLVQRQRFLELQKSLNSAFEHKIIPIVNENDALVYGTDWGFLDNDTLSSSLAIALNADKLLVLSHIDGLYTGDPEKDKSAELVSEVQDVNAELMRLCSKEISDKSRGGMIVKLKVARLCTAVGIEVQIISGLKLEQLKKALQGERSGTTFLARNTKGAIKNRERWILAARSSAASVEVDAGAEEALKKGKSLLAVGIKKIYGAFEKGELVEVVNQKKEGIAIGLVDIGAKELEQKEFKLQKGVQVMHADNVMVFG